MKTPQPTGKAVWGLAILLAFATMGCSTKKFVRQTVAPVEARTAELEKKTATHDGQIEDLDKGVSRADERAMGADSKAQQAATAAGKAQQTADQAQQTADQAGGQAAEAQSLARQGMNRTDEVEHSLSAKMENMDHYTLLSSDSVLFELNKSELTKDAQAQLDAEVQKIGSTKHFVIQVEGFTDTTGTPQYNLELSRQRANAVVRYLTTTGKVPLYRIHVLGYGSEEPVADNSTRQGRQENRRVQVKLFAAESTSAGQESASADTGNP